jgi:hypothetical protein
MQARRPTVVADSAIVAFYQGTGIDGRGRRLVDVHSLNAWALERVHDYIQWLFPLDEPSSANPHAPVLTADDIEAFRSNEKLRKRLIDSLKLMLRFYGLQLRDGAGSPMVAVVTAPDFAERRETWLVRGSHNFLRLTRMMRSLMLLGCDSHAQALFECLAKMYEDQPIAATTFQYWSDAVKPADR